MYPCPQQNQSFLQKASEVTSPRTPKTKKTTKKQYRKPPKNQPLKKHKKTFKKEPVLAMEREARLNTILYKVLRNEGRERERTRESFIYFPCVLQWCFSESSVLFESGSELLQNGSPMAPKIHSKWVPGHPPATFKTRFRKKVLNFP